jgi:uncharacterized protein (DUF1786 family)
MTLNMYNLSMKILSVDVGTGTQDIFLYDTRLDIENGFKLVVPSPTMRVRRRIQAATQSGRPVALHGVTMGGGPSHWAAEDHVEAGLPLFATPEAARSFNDDLDEIAEMGIQVIGEDELSGLPSDTARIELQDFDFHSINKAFSQFGVDLSDLGLLALAVFDHGAAPPGYSDRRFRFEYLDQRVRATNSLSGFAFRSEDIPDIMTRMKSVARSASGIDAPLMLMDTAPAAVLGASLDPVVRSRKRPLIANIGNFHTLAFRLGPTGIEGMFEHHTGFMNGSKMTELLDDFAAGSLTNDFVFNDKGHGALVYHPEPLQIRETPRGPIITGPRRAMMQDSDYQVHYAVPFGDMMLAGCFGMLAAVPDHYPGLGEPILAALKNRTGVGRPPWELA